MQMSLGSPPSPLPKWSALLSVCHNSSYFYSLPGTTSSKYLSKTSDYVAYSLLQCLWKAASLGSQLLYMSTMSGEKKEAENLGFVCVYAYAPEFIIYFNFALVKCIFTSSLVCSLCLKYSISVSRDSPESGFP
jgi:hypothetical protein